MKVLFWGLIIFFFAFGLHLVIWKINRPRQQTKALLWIFLVALAISLILMLFIPSFNMFSSKFIPQIIPEFLHITLLFVSLTLAYIATYSALEVDSPSLKIMAKITEAGPAGLKKETLEETMSDSLLVEPRLNDLVFDKKVYLVKDKYKLSRSGLWLAFFFIFYRKILGISQKGG